MITSLYDKDKGLLFLFNTNANACPDKTRKYSLRQSASGEKCLIKKNLKSI